MAGILSASQMATRRPGTSRPPRRPEESTRERRRRQSRAWPSVLWASLAKAPNLLSTFVDRRPYNPSRLLVAAATMGMAGGESSRTARLAPARLAFGDQPQSQPPSSPLLLATELHLVRRVIGAARPIRHRAREVAVRLGAQDPEDASIGVQACLVQEGHEGLTTALRRLMGQPDDLLRLVGSQRLVAYGAGFIPGVFGVLPERLERDPHLVVE